MARFPNKAGWKEVSSVVSFVGQDPQAQHTRMFTNGNRLAVSRSGVLIWCAESGGPLKSVETGLLPPAAPLPLAVLLPLDCAAAARCAVAARVCYAARSTRDCCANSIQR